MGTDRLKRVAPRVLLTLAIVAALVALLLLERSVERAEQFERWQPMIFLANVLGVVALAVVLALKLLQLHRDYRNHVPGSRLTARTVGIFSTLVIVPLLIVYLFSIEFLERSVDSWFESEIETGLNEALLLSRSTLEQRVQEQRQRVVQLAAAIGRGAAAVELLEAERAATGAQRLEVYDGLQRLRIGAAAGAIAVPLDVELLSAIKSGGDFAGTRPLADGQIIISTAARVPGSRSGDFLVIDYRMPAEVAGLAGAVQSMFTRYGNYTVQREPLKTQFRLALTLVLLFTMLGAVYAAIYSAQRLTRPVQDLIAGTRAVGKGDLATKLPLPSRDELGYLVHSFNDMTKRLRRAREEASANQQAVERERERLAVILSRLSSGVMAIDVDLTLRSANHSASSILGAELGVTGINLEQLAQTQPRLQAFVAELRARLGAGKREWREQLTLSADGGARTLLWACTSLPESAGYGSLVLVFEDISALISAQRNAAWGEVARRLAHEIKNPLTPIQLSAERLRRKLSGGLNSENEQLLERATHTIVQQVDAMKQMVNAFSEYARAPDVRFSRFDLNQLIAEVYELYRLQQPGTRIALELDSALPEIVADRVRIRQVMSNVLSNAQHAVAGVHDGVVRIGSRQVEQRVQVTVSDNGPGLAPDSMESVFEPYVTSKEHGTGLGLAIVKRIVEEHQGSIKASNNSDGGAKFVIDLPLIAERRAEPRRERA